MLNLEGYRSSTDFREILRILQKATTLADNFLWQSRPDGRSVIKLHHFEIDFVSREVVVYFDPKKYQVHPDYPLYVKLDYRVTVFKVADFRQGLNSVHFLIPSEIKTQELRTQPRHQFVPLDERTITVKPSLTSLSRDTGLELNVRTLDISPNGLGVIVSEQNRSFLKNNRILWVTRLNEVLLDRPVLAEVVYMNTELDPKYQNRKQKELKVGLKLSGHFPTDVYQKFIQ